MYFTIAAHSSGLPSREGNGTCLPSDSCTSAGSPLSIGVSKIPGAIVTTRIPVRARSAVENVGMLAGGVIASALGFGGSTGFIGSIIMALIGAIILIEILRSLTGGRGRRRRRYEYLRAGIFPVSNSFALDFFHVINEKKSLIASSNQALEIGCEWNMRMNE